MHFGKSFRISISTGFGRSAPRSSVCFARMLFPTTPTGFGTSRTPSPTKVRNHIMPIFFPHPLGDGQGEGKKTMPHFVRLGTSRTPSPTINRDVSTSFLGVLRKDAVPYNEPGRRGRRPLQWTGTSAPRSSVCFARTPSPTMNRDVEDAVPYNETVLSL